MIIIIMFWKVLKVHLAYEIVESALLLEAVIQPLHLILADLLLSIA